jgi:exopolysaccharide biosynthesis WecB/TagA/CpsF family protein
MPENLKNIKVVITHDYLRTFGGAERVLLILHEIFPKARVYMTTADYKRMGRFGSLFRKLDIETSWAQKLFVFVKKPILYRPILPLVWRSLDVGDVDVVISSSGANIAKAVKIPEGAVHVCYCHTPPRYLYGLETETNFVRTPFLGFFVRMVINYLRVYDQMTSRRVDFFIANSETVKRRIQRYYKRESLIIYPSSNLVNTRKSEIIRCSKISRKKIDYFLVVSRLVSYKHIDVIIKTFNVLGYPLKIVGDGPGRVDLERMAASNVKFVGLISDEELKSYYKNCKALIVTTPEEDFGLTPVEAQSFGRPVIAYYSGGLKESVVEGKTGIFFRRFDEESIKKAIQKFEKTKFNSTTCFNNSQRFSKVNFKKSLVKFICSHFSTQKACSVSRFPKVLLFNKVPFNNISRKEFVWLTTKWISENKKKMICYLNAFGVTNYFKDKDFAKTLTTSSLVYSDGWGPVFASRIFGQKVKERVNAADFIGEFFDKINRKGVRLYLLGDTNEVVKTAAKNIESNYSNIKIVGVHNGFFGGRESLKIVKDIGLKTPDLVLIGMGQPKQEHWLNENYAKLPNATYWCVGGLFNYIAETRKRAPFWMRKSGLEWIYRFFQEPRRLFYRYTVENVYFLFLCLKFILLGRV